MNFFEKLKKFLSDPSKDQHNNNDGRRDYWDPQLDRHEDNNNNFGRFNSRGFSVFSDPLEMQKYFEQQMNDLMRNFGIHTFGLDDIPNSNTSDDFIHFFDAIPPPHAEDFSGSNALQDDEHSDNLREKYLKSGYEKPTGTWKNKKIDEDIDGKFNFGDLDKMFKKNRNIDEVTPFQRQPNIFKFGRSISTKVVVRPDGSQEIHRTSKDNEGNEETTITKKIGEKEHTIITRRNKEGQEERIENILNMDENEVNTFFKPQIDQNPSVDPLRTHKWSLFDSFFK